MKTRLSGGVEMRRGSANVYADLGLADADKLTPNFPWTAFVEAQPLDKPEMVWQLMRLLPARLLP